METRPRTVILSLALLAGAASCKDKPTPRPDPAPPPAASSAAPIANAAAPLPGVPTLIAEKFAPAAGTPDALYPVEGALMVAQGLRVGRIVGDSIEWIGQIPKDNPPFGQSILQGVHGVWPDGIGALYISNGRAPQPTYVSITGKGTRHVFGEGGSPSRFHGVFRLGETIVAAGWTMGTGTEFIPVRGRPVARIQITQEQAGCKPGDKDHPDLWPEEKALRIESIQATRQGTLVAVGGLCAQRTMTAEVWDTAGKAKLVDLSRFWSKHASYPDLVQGSGDELWAWAGAWEPILRYHEGGFEVVPWPERPIEAIFSSPEGQLHAFDGEVIFRLGEGKWIPFARVQPAEGQKLGLYGFAFQDGALWGTSRGAVYRFREGPRAEIPACTTPFVYLYKSSYKNDAKFTYPSTQKALAAFPEAASIGFVEFGQGYSRHVGVIVKDRAQGEALVAHVKATMKDESPRLFCFEPKQDVRRIEIKVK